MAASGCEERRFRGRCRDPARSGACVMPAPRRLDLDTLRIPDAVLTLDGTDYPIRGSALFGERLLELVTIENALLEAKGGDDDQELVRKASSAVTELVRLETPDAPELDL